MGFNLKIKLNGKQLYQTNLVKYYGIRTENKKSPYRQYCCN